MASTPKTRISVFKNDLIAPGISDAWISPIVALNKKLRIEEFGGLDIALGDGIGSVIALQWGQSGSWTTLRAGSMGHFEFRLNRDFLGDAVKRFRVIRNNRSVTSKDMVFWLEGFIL